MTQRAATSDFGREIIRIRAARTHNLRGIDVDLPTGRLTVITGVSGSGKSSLAFDTLFAEGRRRYLESITIQSRSLLQQWPRPDVAEISGLPPTICLNQRVTTAPVRSTLASMTEIHACLRLLFARAGTARCTGCGQLVSSQSLEQIVQRTLALPERSRVMILTPVVRCRRGSHRDALERIARLGFVRVRIDGVLLDLADVKPLTASREHSIEAVVDRIVLRAGIEQRLRESLELACRESGGTCLVCHQVDEQWNERLFSTRYCCPQCDLNFPTLDPAMFSFNSPRGACPTCRGLGFSDSVEDVALLSRISPAACPACSGTRLQPFARGVTYHGVSLPGFTQLSVAEAAQLTDSWLARLPDAGGTADGPASRDSDLVALRTLPEIRRRLACLEQVGVGYLTLDRPARTLSGGEFQRARLAACLGSGLHGACFVLDEPTVGLHPRDTNRLLQTLLEIRDEGATVVVVEHDETIMRHADWIVDLGPGAGADGGQLLFAGTPEDAARLADSPTGRYLRGESLLPVSRRSADHPFGIPLTAGDMPVLGIRGACLNNLQGISLTIPLQRLVCVSGVSGSGKSSLIIDTLLPLARAACQSRPSPKIVPADVQCEGIDGIEQIRRVVAFEDRPGPGQSRSCLATMTGLWNEIRQVFVRTRDARLRGYRSQRFSLNSGDGRCAMCRGSGTRSLKLGFLPEATVPCPGCRGRRFNQATLSVRFRHRSVADILEMRVDEAAEFFSEFPRLAAPLATLQQVGVAYLRLGQPASTLSGGEAQRIRLAAELTDPQRAHTLYVLDEPTSGLHPLDVARLISLLQDLVRAGHSVIVVEHHPDVMRFADWLIDLGPDSGAAGGTVVAAGPPAWIIESGQGFTADALRRLRF